MEIERKFQVNELPKQLDCYMKKVIKQGYLCTGPVVRIRQSNDRYILTYKNRKGLSQEHALMCEEVELDLTKEAFEHLINKVDGNIIEKTRYLVPLESGYTAELDVFEGVLSGFMLVEVEFATQEHAKDFVKPDWFGEDVSHDKRYRNSYLKDIKSIEELGLKTL